MGRIHVEENALIELKNAFSTMGDNYKENYGKLTKLIEEITSGHIQGDPADELLKKYNDKKESFNKILELIEGTQVYLSGRTDQFIEDVTTLMTNMQ